MPATPASEWKAANQKDVTLPSGRVATIRKLTTEFLLVIRELAENLLAAGEMTAKPVIRVRDQRNYIRAVVREGVVRPKVAPDGREPAEDEVAVDDFGEDLDALVTELHTWNEGILVTPFRPAPGGATPEPLGEGVRGEPERLAEEAAE